MEKVYIWYRGDLADIEAAGWQTGQKSSFVKLLEKAGIHSSTDIARIETSLWETGQPSIFVKSPEECVRRSDVIDIKASGW